MINKSKLFCLLVALQTCGVSVQAVENHADNRKSEHVEIMRHMIHSLDRSLDQLQYAENFSTQANEVRSIVQSCKQFPAIKDLVDILDENLATVGQAVAGSSPQDRKEAFQTYKASLTETASALRDMLNHAIQESEEAEKAKNYDRKSEHVEAMRHMIHSLDQLQYERYFTPYANTVKSIVESCKQFPAMADMANIVYENLDTLSKQAPLSPNNLSDYQLAVLNANMMLRNMINNAIQEAEKAERAKHDVISEKDWSQDWSRDWSAFHDNLGEAVKFLNNAQTCCADRANFAGEAGRLSETNSEFVQFMKKEVLKYTNKYVSLCDETRNLLAMCNQLEKQPYAALSSENIQRALTIVKNLFNIVEQNAPIQNDPVDLPQEQRVVDAPVHQSIIITQNDAVLNHRYDELMKQLESYRATLAQTNHEGPIDQAITNLIQNKEQFCNPNTRYAEKITKGINVCLKKQLAMSEATKQSITTPSSVQKTPVSQSLPQRQHSFLDKPITVIRGQYDLDEADKTLYRDLLRDLKHQDETTQIPTTHTVSQHQALDIQPSNKSKSKPVPFPPEELAKNQPQKSELLTVIEDIEHHYQFTNDMLQYSEKSNIWVDFFVLLIEKLKPIKNNVSKDKQKALQKMIDGLTPLTNGSEIKRNDAVREGDAIIAWLKGNIQ